jgi:hypothetical protein
MEHKDSLRHLQKRATCPHPEPDRQSAFPIQFNIIFFSTPSSSKRSLYFLVPHHIPYAYFLFPYLLHAQPIPFFFIFSHD